MKQYLKQTGNYDESLNSFLTLSESEQSMLTSHQGVLKQHMSKGILSPIMERTLESMLSPMPNKSFGSTNEQNIGFGRQGMGNEERKLSGTGTYKIDAALGSVNVQDDDDD